MKTPALTAWNALLAGNYRTIEKKILRFFDIFMMMEGRY